MLKTEKKEALLYKNGKEYVQVSSKLEPIERPEPGAYTIKVVEKQVTLVKKDNYVTKFPKKLYGDFIKRKNTIISAWLTRTANTGVMLSGNQGVGKSLLAQAVIYDLITLHNAICIEITEPIVSEEAFEYIEFLKCPVVIFIDEFEKKYNKEQQAKLLSFMDGSTLKGVMFLLTVNDAGSYMIQPHLFHRPNRLYFHYKFTDVSMEECKDLIENNLDAIALKKRTKSELSLKELKLNVLRSIAKFSIRTYDSILSFIGEINRSGNMPEEVLTYLNIVQLQKANTTDKVYYRIFVINTDKTEEDITDDYDTRTPTRIANDFDIFGDGDQGKRAIKDWDDFTFQPNTGAYPMLQAVKLNGDTWIQDDNFKITKYKIGETPAGKDIVLEFSKVKYPPKEKREPEPIFKEQKPEPPYKNRPNVRNPLAQPGALSDLLSITTH